MVQQWKMDKVKELKKVIDETPVVGIIDMHNLPAPQLQMIKKSLKEDAKIVMTKKMIIKFALEKSSKKKIEELGKFDICAPALIFSKKDPFKLSKFIEKSKSPSYAKAGDISPRDIIVPEGPTNLPPGPVIGELQKAGVKAIIAGDKIAVKEDSLIVKEGEEISEQVANILMKLDVKPMEIGLNLVGAYENEIIYERETLRIDEEEYKNNLQNIYRNAFNLTINIGYATKENIELLLQKAAMDSLNLALNNDIITKETVENFIQKAQNQALSLKSKIPEVEEKPKEEIKDPEEKEVKEEKKPEEIDVDKKEKKEE